MKKILDFVADGKGLGIRLLLILSFLAALISGITVKYRGTVMLPLAQSVADQMLPIRVVDGNVTEPVNVVKAAYLDLGNGEGISLPFVINTTVDNLDINNLSDGFYLSRTTLYFVQRNQVRLTPLEGSFDLPRGDYRALFEKILNWTALFTVIFGAVICFLFYFLLCIFYAFCLFISGKLFSCPADFDTRMRAAVVAVIGVYLLFWLLAWTPLADSVLLNFVTTVAAGTYLLQRLCHRSKA